MRTMVQAGLAFLVLGGAVALAVPPSIDYPSGDFSSAVRANATHTARVRGKRPARTKFWITYGGTFYGSNYLSLYAGAQRTYPTLGNSTTSFGLYFKTRRGTRRHVTGAIDTRRLRGEELQTHLAEYQYSLNSLIAAEDTSGTVGVLGNMTLNRAWGTSTSRFVGNTSQSVHVVVQYSGRVGSGPNVNRPITGTLDVSVRGAPTATDAKR